MSDYAQIMAAEVEAQTELANAQIRNGQAAHGVLLAAPVADFFAAHTYTLVAHLLAVDVLDEKATAAVVMSIQALHAFHSHLTQAVTTGLVAAQRLAEQAKQGDPQ